MKVLVTGGCGFIGTNLIARLEKRGGHRIRVLDNESLGKREHLAGLAVEFVKGDIRDRAAVDHALQGMDAVVHLAADTRVIESIDKPQYNFEVNAIGTLNVLEGMRALGTKRLINASTGGAILGEVEPPVHEEMVAHPASPYGASKLAAEGYCSAYAGSYGFNTLSLRFSNVYGPRSFHKGSVVAAFLRNILAGKGLTIYGDGTQVRDFIYVEDLCDGIISGLTAPTTGVIQLGSGNPTTVNELLAVIKSVVAPKTFDVTYKDFRAGELYATYCDISKARRELGYNPETDLAVGLSRTWEWFVQQQEQRQVAAAQ